MLEVDTAHDQLAAIRSALDGADDALLGVAFVRAAGVNLLAEQLDALPSGRLVTTTVFGSTTHDGLTGAQRRGLDVRVLNPAGGTFHPKLYLAKRGKRTTAVVGSANITSGLFANVESVVVLRGDSADPQLRRLWDRAESWWSHRAAVDWTPTVTTAPREILDTQLMRRLGTAAGTDVTTLGSAQRNWINAVTPEGIYVETAASRRKGHGPQLVEAWMLQVAWDWLTTHGELTNAHLLATDGLNVKRSSFVCAVLAKLPEVEVASTRPIRLRLRQPVPAGPMH